MNDLKDFVFTQYKVEGEIYTFVTEYSHKVCGQQIRFPDNVVEAMASAVQHRCPEATK